MVSFTSFYYHPQARNHWPDSDIPLADATPYVLKSSGVVSCNRSVANALFIRTSLLFTASPLPFSVNYSNSPFWRWSIWPYIIVLRNNTSGFWNKISLFDRSACLTNIYFFVLWVLSFLFLVLHFCVSEQLRFMLRVAACSVMSKADLERLGPLVGFSPLSLSSVVWLPPSIVVDWNSHLHYSAGLKFGLPSWWDLLSRFGFFFLYVCLWWTVLP